MAIVPARLGRFTLSCETNEFPWPNENDNRLAFSRPQEDKSLTTPFADGHDESRSCHPFRITMVNRNSAAAETGARGK